MKKLSVLVVLLVVACGKRGDPRPPVPVIPRATSDLVVAQRADKIVLTWSYPSLTTAGRSLTSLRRVVVYRHYEEAPTGTATPPALAPAQFAKLATRLDSIEGANLKAATVGSRLVFTDQPPIRSSSGRPRRYTYAVVTEGEADKGDFSNLAVIVPLDAATPPTTLKAIANPGGVTLEWPAPTASVSGGTSPVIIGYNVYRMAGSEGTPNLESPLNTAPLTATTFTDTPPYGEHQYRVTAVAFTGPPRIESLPSPPATVLFRDLVAPPVPTNVSELVETRIVRLVWDAVDAPDLDGYNVYRYEMTSRLKMTPTFALKSPIFKDESPNPGIEYIYAVTSIDKNGNESAETKSKPVTVPKTP